jgi:hypothetical protein
VSIEKTGSQAFVSFVGGPDTRTCHLPIHSLRPFLGSGML